MIFTSFESSSFVKCTAIYNFSIEWLWDYSVTFSVLKTSIICNIWGLLDHQSVFECVRSTHNQKLMNRKWIMLVTTLWLVQFQDFSEISLSWWLFSSFGWLFSIKNRSTTSYDCHLYRVTNVNKFQVTNLR